MDNNYPKLGHNLVKGNYIWEVNKVVNEVNKKNNLIEMKKFGFKVKTQKSHCKFCFALLFK